MSHLLKSYSHLLSKVVRVRTSPGSLCRGIASATNKTDKSSLTSNLLLLIPITTFGLGTWQVQRLQWKKNLIRQMEAQTTAEPIDLPEDLTNIESMNYRRVKIVGEFDHSKELFLGPRTVNKPTQGLASNEGGYHIVTPFRLLDSGERILVNRGWVPKNRIKPENRAEGQIEGPIEMVAIVRKKEQRPPFMVRNDPQKNSWHYLDIDRMAANANTLPVMVDSDAASSVAGGPIGGQTRIKLRNAHLEYIITWYTLSAITCYLYYQLRKKPGKMFSHGPR